MRKFVMLNTRLTAARRIAEALVPSEGDIDTAIASTAQLIGTIAQARSETNVPLSMCQDSLAALSATMAALVEARCRIAAAHEGLAKARVEAGLRAYGMGDVSECPPSAGLKLVEEGRAAA
jgi:hypothetical protein